jgi:hypothetical protein
MRRYTTFHFCALLFLVLRRAGGQDFSPDQPPFTTSPNALQNAFSKVDPGKHPIVILLQEGRYEFDAEGRGTVHFRTIFKAITKTAATDWAMIEHTWAPWQEERPAIRARVIAKDGSVHELDPKTIADAPARDNDDRSALLCPRWMPNRSSNRKSW